MCIALKQVWMNMCIFGYVWYKCGHNTPRHGTLLISGIMKIKIKHLYDLPPISGFQIYVSE